MSLSSSRPLSMSPVSSRYERMSTARPVEFCQHTYAHLVITESPATPEWRPYSIHTASKYIADRRAERCAGASNAV